MKTWLGLDDSAQHAGREKRFSPAVIMAIALAVAVVTGVLFYAGWIPRESVAGAVIFGALVFTAALPIVAGITRD